MTDFCSHAMKSEAYLVLVYSDNRVRAFIFVSADGLAEPSDNCSPGWFCTGGSWQAEPTTVDNATSLSQCSCPDANYTGSLKKWQLQ